ncbi:MAG: hypothetical protein LBV29_01330 [Azoarcus sp.]|nr:hypothetical protein [Azoarcus sp.]
MTFKPLRTRQRGQALTEVALSALLVLVPTFIFGWTLHSYGQARTSALNGARYAAWERTAWRESGVSGASTTAIRSQSEIEKLMVERFFARPDAPIKSSYSASETAKNADVTRFSSLHNGGNALDIEKAAGSAGPREGARPKLELKSNGEQTSTIASVFNKFSDAMSKVGAGGMTLEDKGLYVAKVDVKLNAVRHVKVFEDLNLEITQRAAVVADSWSAGGRAYEEAVVKPMVPASALGGITKWLEPLGPWTPFKEFKPGCIRGDVAPRDMLPSGSSQTSGVCK